MVVWEAPAIAFLDSPFAPSTFFSSSLSCLIAFSGLFSVRLAGMRLGGLLFGLRFRLGCGLRFRRCVVHLVKKLQ